jgi:hypothetical protein
MSGLDVLGGFVGSAVVIVLFAVVDHCYGRRCGRSKDDPRPAGSAS